MSQTAPAESLGVEELAVPLVNDHHVVVLVQVGLEGRLGVAHQVTLVSSLVGCPPECVALCVFFPKYHQHLEQRTV